MKKRFKRMSLEKRKGLMGYFFCAPFILGLVFIFFSTLILSFEFSIYEVKTEVSGYTMIYKGLEYYRFALLEDPNFIQDIFYSVTGMFRDMLVILIYALFVAVLLNQRIKGRVVFRAIFFLPVIIATGIISQVEAADIITQQMMTGGKVDYISLSGDAADLSLFDYLKGIIMSVNLSEKFTSFIFDAVTHIYDIVSHSGVQIVIFLAGLQSISPSIYEAAYVEGCSEWEKFWKITLPLVSPLILVNTVWTIVDYFLNPDNAVMTDITTRFRASEYSLAAAMSFVNFAVMAVIVSVTLAVINRFVFYENK